VHAAAQRAAPTCHILFLAAFACLLQGLWELSFKMESTLPSPFTLEGGSQVEVRVHTSTSA
jgi:hypothetical protein